MRTQKALLLIIQAARMPTKLRDKREILFIKAQREIEQLIGEEDAKALQENN